MKAATLSEITPAALRAWRRSSHLTQQQAADLLGVHQRSIRKWERGERQIPNMLALALEALTSATQRCTRDSADARLGTATP